MMRCTRVLQRTKGRHLGTRRADGSAIGRRPLDDAALSGMAKDRDRLWLQSLSPGQPGCARTASPPLEGIDMNGPIPKPVESLSPECAANRRGVYVHLARHLKAVRISCPRTAYSGASSLTARTGRRAGACWRSFTISRPFHPPGRISPSRGDGVCLFHGACVEELLARTERGRSRRAVLLCLAVPRRGGGRSLESRCPLVL
jgi:hypothetical protein